MSPKRARRVDHRTFCLREGWALVRGATGKPVGHHETYELKLSDGRILRTRISRPADSPQQYSPRLWGLVLRQLDVSEAEFWACVQRKQLPRRALLATPATAALPPGIVAQLIANGATRQEIAAMDLPAARRYLAEVWLRDQPSPRTIDPGVAR